MLPRLPDRKWLLLVCALPGSAFALGLGDIHLNSALGHPLVAQIDLLDVEAADLPRLKARLADSETFQRHGLAYPAFMAGTTLTLTQGADGHPVLIARSNEPFTEPVVTLLVEVRAPAGNLLREYTLLLDPPGFAPEQQARDSTPAAEPETPSQPAAQTPATAPVATVTAPAANSAARHSRSTYTVARRDTLRRIAARVASKSGSNVEQTMWAIFRGNPLAFDRNINLLRAGATLDLPTDAQLSAISPDTASHEIAAQMVAWNATRRRAKPAISTTVTAAASPAAPETDESDADVTRIAALTQRIESLQSSMDRISAELRAPLPMPMSDSTMPAAAHPEATATSAKPESQAATAAPRAGTPKRLPWIAGGLAALLLLGIWLGRAWRRVSKTAAAIPAVLDPTIYRELATEVAAAPIQADSHAAVAAPANVPVVTTDAAIDQSKPAPSATLALPALSEDDMAPTVEQPAMKPKTQTRPAVTSAEQQLAEDDLLAQVLNEDGETVELNYEFFNPESTLNTTHVMIPSALHESTAFIERRRSPVDVLRQAIEREPARHDLRLKLLELYYSAAAQNQQAFLQIARQLAGKEKVISEQEWAQIADMGRKIAPDNELFDDEDDDQAVA